MGSPDHVHPPRSSHAEHPAAGQERPGSSAGAHEECPCAGEYSETGRCGCYSDGSVILCHGIVDVHDEMILVVAMNYRKFWIVAFFWRKWSLYKITVRRFLDMNLSFSVDS